MNPLCWALNDSIFIFAAWFSTVDSCDLHESSDLVDAKLYVDVPLTSKESSDLFITEFDEPGPVTSVKCSAVISDGQDAIEPLISMRFVVSLVDSLSLLASIKASGLVVVGLGTSKSVAWLISIWFDDIMDISLPFWSPMYLAELYSHIKCPDLSNICQVNS